MKKEPRMDANGHECISMDEVCTVTDCALAVINGFKNSNCVWRRRIS